MKSVRLTNVMKDAIVGDLVRSLQEAAKVSDLEATMHTIGREIRDDILGDQKRAFESMPAEFLNTDIDFRIKIKRAKEDTADVWMRVDLGKYMRMWANTYRPIKEYAESTPIIKRYKKARAALKKVNEDIVAAKTEARNVLKGVSTTKKLLEVWPEAESYIDAQPEPVKALTVQSDTLNCLIANVTSKKKADCNKEVARTRQH